MVLSVLARRNRIRLAGALVAAASLAMAIAAEAQQSTVECKPTATLQRVPELPKVEAWRPVDEHQDAFGPTTIPASRCSLRSMAADVSPAG